MKIFQERIDKIEVFIEKDRLQEAFDEYKVLLLLVKKLESDDRTEIYRKTKFLGDRVILKMLKLKLNKPIKSVEKNHDIKEQIEISNFYDKLEEYQEICDLIQKENYLGALGKFNKC